MDDRTITIAGEINACKQLLAQTDYKAIKYAEGQITKADYAAIKAQRQAWRDRINALEAELAALEKNVPDSGTEEGET